MRRQPRPALLPKSVWIALLFAGALAWVDAETSLFWFHNFGLDPKASIQPADVDALPSWAVQAEQGREVALVIMVAAVAVLAAGSWRQRAAVALLVVAVWTVGFCAFRKLLSGFPSSLGTVDCVALVPAPLLLPTWFVLLGAVASASLGLNLLRGKGGQQ